MKTVQFFKIAMLSTVVALTSCEKKDDNDQDDQKNATGCTGTNVSANTWAVIDADGKTTTIPVTSSNLYKKESDDKMEYHFYGKTSSLGDNVYFTFKGKTAPKSGTYTLIGTDKSISAGNEVISIGVGGGTATMGGGLFSLSGNITVTSNDAGVTIEGKGLNYKTALGKALCVSVKLTHK